MQRGNGEAMVGLSARQHSQRHDGATAASMASEADGPHYHITILSYGDKASLE